MTEIKYCRIGDYAKYLGVTPDLLKHYEQLGLISPERTEKGYRYYSFQTTALLIESIRLRNYGMTLREMSEILVKKSIRNADMERHLQSNLENIRQEMLLDEALVRDYEEFLEWKGPLAARDFDWVIKWSRPMLFLPHTNRYEFLTDPRIYELLKEWMSYVPIVKSTMKAHVNGDVFWGFAIDRQKHRELGLPINSVVEEIPSQKVFYYKYRGKIRTMSEESPDTAGHPAFRMLSDMNLNWGDTYYRTTLMPADWADDLYMQYAFYAIPLREGQI